MKFDVIIGNPPYQLGDGGAQKSASPIYHKFVTQAKKLKPSFLAMIIPARWYTGGKGLDSFRAEMLEDEKICEIHDFPSTKDCFPGVNVRGGICYFLRDSGHKGDCNVFSHRGDEILGPVSRPLLEEGTNIFVRFNEAVGILKKVQLAKEPSFSDLVSSRKAFGLNTLVKGKGEATSKTVKLYRDRGQVGYIERGKIVKNAHWIDEWKVLVPYSSPGGDDYPHLILGNPIVSGPGSCATETHLVVGPFPSEKVCENARLYMKSKFLRFLVMLSKASQHVTRKTYQFVPEQDFSEKWSDEKLYQKYSLNEDEISFIESMIKQRD